MILIRTGTVPYDNFGRVQLENGTSLSESHLGKADLYFGMSTRGRKQSRRRRTSPVTRSLRTIWVTFVNLYRKKDGFSGNSTP